MTVVSIPITNASIPRDVITRVTPGFEFIFVMKPGAFDKISARDAVHERRKKRRLMIREER
jgi:hypothetical protein